MGRTSRVSAGVRFCMREMRSWLDRLRGFFREEISTSELRSRLGATHAAAGGIKIVALVADERDRELLSRLASEHHWILHFAATCGEAWEALNKSKAPIVLCDRELPAAEWRDVIQRMVSSPHQAYAILVSTVADDYLWNEVVMWGGHDVLVTPLREENVLRAIRLAWLYWNSALKSRAGVA